MPANATAAWHRADGWAFSEIYFRCTPELQLSLSDTMTALEAWTLLHDLYQNASIANLLYLNTRFNCLHQKVGQTAFQFITGVVTLSNEIRHMGDNISDRKMKFHIHGHLLPEFAPLVTTLTNIDNANLALDLKTLREAILREERTIIKNKVQSLSPPALPVPLAPLPLGNPLIPPMANASRSNAPRPPFHGCSHCGNSRHSSDSCWVKYPDLRPRRW